MTITVRAITPQQHRDWIADQQGREDISFLQTPAWGQVKPEWRSESLGWFDGTRMIGAGLALYRKVPRVPAYLAYLPEGPVLDWRAGDVAELLAPLVEHARRSRAFALRIGPTVVHRRWKADTIKAAIADPELSRLSQATPDITNPDVDRLIETLRALGWRAPSSESVHFAAGQPMFNFQLPIAGRTSDELLSGMNQLWRRNIKKAIKSGVQVRVGTRADLGVFHTMYLETAQRDGFTPRPREYFETMWDALNAEQPDRMRVYVAEWEGTPVATTTWVHVNGHVWYSYGASTNEHRDVRGSNAVQWQMIRDALDVGASVYDMRGITEGIGAQDPELGLIQFKVGTGGEAVAFPGEWDLPLNRVLYAVFNWYMGRRTR